MKKRILSMLLVIVMVLSLVPVSALADGGTLKIVSSGATMNFVIDRDTEFALTVKEGENAVDGVTWSAEPTGVVHPMALATGKLIGLNPGDVTVKATLSDGRTVTKNFSVYQLPTNLQIAKVEGSIESVLPDTVYLKKGDNINLKYVCDNDSEVSKNTITKWELKKNNGGALSFDQTTHILTAEETGSADLRLAVNGSEKIVTFNVTEDVAGHITAAPEVKKLTVGDTVKLTVGFTGSEPYPDGDAITWTCASNDVELTRNGKECAVLGKTPTSDEIEIVARWTGNCVAYKLQVVDAAPLSIAVGENPVSELTLTGSKEQKTLTVTGLPEGKTPADIEWGVASGDDVLNVTRKGTDLEVSGVKAGTAVVTAKIKGLEGTQASVTITVEPKATIANKPADGSKKTLYVNDTFTCELEPELVDAKELTLVPSDTEAVEINGNAITAKKAATGVKISLMKGETEFDSFLLDVLGQARIEIDPEMPREMLTGDKLDLKAVVKDASGAVVEGKTVSWKYLDSIDANMSVLGSDKLSVSPNPTIPFDVELRAYLNDEVLGELSADVTIHVTPRTASVALMKGTENVSNKTTILSVKDTAGITIQAVIMPENARQVVSWEVTPGDICEFTTHDDSIEIKPASSQKTGTVTVIATAADGTGVRCETKVELVKTADTIQITNAPAQMHGGANLQLRTNLDEDNTLTDRRVVWSVSKEFEQLASVTADGFLDTKPVTQRTPIKVEVTLVANGAKGEATITLCPAVTNIKIVRNNGTKLENVLAYTSEPIALGREVTPASDYCGSFVWTSSNEKVATVNPETGVMELKDAGNVRISCTAYDTDFETALKIARGEIRDDSKVMAIGYKSLEIVKKATDVVIDANGVTELVSGKNTVFTATVYTDLATGLKAGNQKVTWSVVDENYEPTSAATINSRGRLYAKTVNRGTDVIVIARSVENKDAYGEYNVRIKPKQEKTFMAVMTADPEDMVLGSSLNLNIGVETSIFGQWYIREEDVFVPEYDCTYFTSNSDVASIDANGTLKTKKAGSTVITVRATDVDSGNVYTAKFTLRVANLVGFVQIGEPKSNVLNSGNDVTLSAITWTDSGMSQKAANQGITWKVYQKNEDGDYVTAQAASVSSGGKVHANTVTKNTTVYVVATSKENSDYYDYCEMIIRPKYDYTLRVFYEDTVDGEKVERTGTWNVKSGDAADLAKVKAKVYNAAAKSGNGDDETPKVTWSTSNSKIIDVNHKSVGNKLTYGGKTGKVKVTAKYVVGKNTYTASMYLNVVKPVTGITVSAKTGSASVYSGKTLLVVAKVNSDATNKSVIWTTDASKDVATINSTTGLIRANKGLTKKVTINVTATAADGSATTGTKQVTIYPLASKVTITTTIDGKNVPVTALEVGRNKSNVDLNAVLTPEEEANQAAVKWTSSRTSIVKVDQTGKLTTGIRKGTATIKAAATDGSGKYTTIKVTVK